MGGGQIASVLPVSKQDPRTLPGRRDQLPPPRPSKVESRLTKVGGWLPSIWAPPSPSRLLWTHCHRVGVQAMVGEVLPPPGWRLQEAKDVPGEEEEGHSHPSVVARSLAASGCELDPAVLTPSADGMIWAVGSHLVGVLAPACPMWVLMHRGCSGRSGVLVLQGISRLLATQSRGARKSSLGCGHLLSAQPWSA